MEKTNTLVIRVVDFQKNKPIQKVKVRVSKIEKSVTLKQWAENLKNGSPFKSLVLSMNTDNKGIVTVQLPVGTYEAEVEKYGFKRVCELTQNVEVLVIEPKKHWWQ